MAHQSSDCPLSPAETARRFGVSIKALRLYEQRGLLKPVRSGNGRGPGWRVYSPDQIARLHQILALKALGLSLARIGALLKGPDKLASVLAMQEQALTRQSDQLARALGLVRAARAKCAGGMALSIDDLAILTKETVMTRLSAKEMNLLLTPFADRNISREEKEAIKAKVPDRDQMAKEVDGLMAEAHALMQLGDPTSPAAQELARRWSAFGQPLLDNTDAQTRAKFKSIWSDAENDPALAPKLALTREIFGFIERAVVHWKAQAK